MMVVFVLKKMKQLILRERSHDRASRSESTDILHSAAKILRTDIDMCRRERRREQTTEVSFPAAEKMVPISPFNFTAMLLCKKTRLTQGEEETYSQLRTAIS